MVICKQEFDFNGSIHAPEIAFFNSQKVHLLEWDERVQKFVPDLTIEIASPSDTYGGLLQEKDRYLAAGTKEVWLISAETREVAIYPQNRILRGSDELTTLLIPGFSITIERLFAEAEA